MVVSPTYLGENKTVAPYYVGPVLGAMTFFLYGHPEWWHEGALLGLGAVAGDHIKSVFKRRLGYPPGYSWLPDRFDFALGGGLVAWWYYWWVTWEHVLCLVLIALPVHYFGNRLSYKIGLRKTPH